MRDYYQVLEVDRRCSPSEIKQAYRKMALRWHPDKRAADAEEACRKFAEVTEAYGVLSNEGRRRKYDAGLDLLPVPAGSRGSIFSQFYQGFLLGLGVCRMVFADFEDADVTFRTNRKFGTVERTTTRKVNGRTVVKYTLFDANRLSLTVLEYVDGALTSKTVNGVTHAVEREQEEEEEVLAITQNC